HFRTVLGFEDYIRENKIDLKVIQINGYANTEELRSRLIDALANHPEIRGAFSVSARLSVQLADLVAELHRADEIRVIASDLFEETIRNMEAGIVKNIIFKDPESQAYLATKVMSDYLLKAQKPSNDIQYVESRVIFKSNLRLYTANR
ncbi:MAG: sugar ABC transporter substrate-binding protein, partial [Butyricicoccus sp.]